MSNPRDRGGLSSAVSSGANHRLHLVTIGIWAPTRVIASTDEKAKCDIPVWFREELIIAPDETCAAQLDLKLQVQIIT